MKIVKLSLLFILKMRNTVYYIFIFLLCSSCSSRDSYNEIIAKAESIVSTYPDSTLYILQTIMFPENLVDSTKANYWLVLGQAHYNASKSMADDSLIISSLQYYRKNNNAERLLQSYKLAAQYKWWNNEKEDAYNLLKEGLNVAENNKDTVGLINLYLSLTDLADKDNDLENSLSYIKMLMQLDKKSPHYYRYYNDLGIIYYYLNQKEESISAFEKCLKTSLEAKDSIWVYYSMYRNYADILNDIGKSKEAIRHQEKILDYYIRNNSDHKSIAYFSLSVYYTNSNILDSARYYMNLADRTRPKYYDDDLAISNFYLIQRTILDYATDGKYSMKEIWLFSNNMFSKYIDKERKIAEKSITKQNLEQRNLRLTIIKQKNQITLLIISISLILISAFSYFHIQKRRRILTEKEEELETLNHLLLEAQKSNNEKDGNFFKRILLQQLGIIRLAAMYPTAQNQEFLQQMTRITNKDIPVETLLVWDDFYKVVDSVYDNFHTNLIFKYGSILLDKEIQLCCLLMAGFSTKEISVVTQQSVRTVYQRKTTIRQKLKMGEKEDIADFLQA